MEAMIVERCHAQHFRSWGKTMATLSENERASLAAACVALALFLPPVPVAAQGFGDFTVTPTRILFEDRSTNDVVTVINRGAETATFRISFLHMRMAENGELIQIDQLPEGYKAAEPLLRFAPRQIEIPPGSSQVVRLSLRKPADLPEGEYRSHMFFRAVPPESRGQAIDQAPDQAGNLRIELIPIFGVTIPIIVRHGAGLVATARLENLSLQTRDGIPVLAASVGREGEASLFGDLSVAHLPSGGGPARIIAELNRLSVYPDIPARRVEIPLRLPDDLRLDSGTLELTYRSADPTAEVLARATLALP